MNADDVEDAAKLQEEKKLWNDSKAVEKEKEREKENITRKEAARKPPCGYVPISFKLIQIQGD